MSHSGQDAPLLPDRCAGVVLPISALPSPFAIGDVGDAALRFLETLVEMKLRVWQFLPTGPTAYGDSPYQPLSAFAGNTNLLGLEPLLRAGLLEPGEVDALRGLADGQVDYGSLIPRKNKVLQQAASRFASHAQSSLQAAFHRFLEQHGKDWLEDYVLYRVLKDRFEQQAWTSWPEPFRRRDPAALAALRQDAAEALERERVLQFLFDWQWQSLRAHAHRCGVQLFGDMPIYISLDSADAWAHPEMLRMDETGQPAEVAGVPPDYFSAEGQLWGNPLYDWAQHADTGYRWWIARVAHAARQLDLVRIDHFRGFEAFWAVPFAAETAREGAWEPGPGDALFAALREPLGHLPIVAEDLGLITPEVHALRERQGLPGMVVLQFAVDDPEFELQAMSPMTVCYTGTHDNDTTLGWFSGAGDDTRSPQALLNTQANALRLTRGASGTINLDLIRLALNSPAQLALVPLQDFLGLGSEARLNRPGTTLDNWRWRVLPEQLGPDFCHGVARLAEACGRG